MTLTDTTQKSQWAALSFEFDLPHAPEKVWRALTEPELLAQWLLPVIGLKLERGASFTFKTQAHGDWDGTVNCRVRDVDAPRKISYDWIVGDMATVVTFTLTPTAAGTHLHLVHSGFREDQKKNFGGARYGWNMMGGKLIDLLGRES
jgi:uncharacterized protein YndB with AHSA1/START domain